VQRRAKILCTLGPATDGAAAIDELVASGMNAARLNFSHGERDYHREVYERLRAASARHGVALAIVADLQGPKIRVARIPPPGLVLRPGEPFVLSVDPAAPITASQVGIDYAGLADEVAPGDPVLLDDGTLELVVERREGPAIHTRVVTGGTLTARKGVNVPRTRLSLPVLTDKDHEDLRFALELGVDFIALSFVRRASDLDEVRAVMDAVGRKVPVIAKLEKPQAVENLDAIAEAADGIMVARGDLGVEMGPEEVPVVQKQAIDACNARGKLVITATQMLDSMIRNPRPTRAEASDVANAVFDGSDAVMLSGETAIGKHPFEAVRTMDRIIRRAEEADRYWREPPPDMRLGHSANAIARAAAQTSLSLGDTKAIVAYTGSGGIARLISDYRPAVPIYAFTPSTATYHALALYWGVLPVAFSPSDRGGDSIFDELDEALRSRGLVEAGGRVVIVLGWPLAAHKSVNMLKLHRVGEGVSSGG
jgi:pyruvate kinase